MSHMKSTAAPKSWNILRKETKFITRPSPGAHSFDKAIPACLLLKQLNLAKTTKEVKYIINNKAVSVDGKPIKDLHHAIGFMDGIQIKPKTSLRCTINEKGKIAFIEAPETQVTKKITKIVSKKTIRGGKTQLNLLDGRNIIADGKYNVGDSLLMEVPTQKIIEHLQLENGNTVFLYKGKHIGSKGKITEIKGNRLWCMKDDKKIETLKQYAIVIGKDKPAINI